MRAVSQLFRGASALVVDISTPLETQADGGALQVTIPTTPGTGLCPPQAMGYGGAISIRIVGILFVALGMIDYLPYREERTHQVLTIY